MLRIEPKTRHLKGKVHIVIEFVDPCDKVSKLTFYENNDPFASHDFSNKIPNPKTPWRNMASTDKLKCNKKVEIE